MIPKHANQLLEEINKLDYKVKSKEVSFIKSVKNNIKNDVLLSPAMAKWLTNIYSRASGGGSHQNREFIR